MRLKMKDYLVSKSWREAVFYAYQLKYMFDIDSKSLIDKAYDLREADDFLHQEISRFRPEEIKKALRNSHSNLYDNDFKSELFSSLKKSFDEEEQLTNDNFEWIKNDNRICAFCYYFLKTHTLHRRDKDGNDDLKRDRYALQSQEKRKNLNSILDRNNSIRLFEIHDRKLEHNSHKERLKIIKSAFLYGEIELEGQQYIMSLLLEAWTKSLKEETNIKLYKWLNGKNNQQVTWLCDYIKKQDSMFYLPWDPINEEERYIALQAELDYVFIKNPRENKYLFIQARLAWNQMTARNKKNGPKSRGISMSERTSKRLNWLTAHKDEKINAVIKELIDNEFEFLGGPSKL